MESFGPHVKSNQILMGFVESPYVGHGNYKKLEQVMMAHADMTALISVLYRLDDGEMFGHPL